MTKQSTLPNVPFLVHLGKAIRDRRIKLLISQEELGLRSGLHRTYVTEIENGLRNMSIKTMLRVAAGLESPMSHSIAAAEKAMNLLGRK